MPIPIEVHTLRQSLATAVQNISMNNAFSAASFKVASYFATEFYAATYCATAYASCYDISNYCMF